MDAEESSQLSLEDIENEIESLEALLSQVVPDSDEYTQLQDLLQELIDQKLLLNDSKNVLQDNDDQNDRSIMENNTSTLRESQEVQNDTPLLYDPITGQMINPLDIEKKSKKTTLTDSNSSILASEVKQAIQSKIVKLKEFQIPEQLAIRSSDNPKTIVRKQKKLRKLQNQHNQRGKTIQTQANIASWKKFSSSSKAYKKLKKQKKSYF